MSVSQMQQGWPFDHGLANVPPAVRFNRPPLATRMPPRGIDRATQDKNGNTYGEQSRERPSHKVQPPAGIAIGMIEINTFFPNWVTLPRVAMRAVHGGWGSLDLARAQLCPQGLLDDKAKFDTSRSRIQHQLRTGAKMYHGWTAHFNGEKVLRKPHEEVFGHTSLKEVYDQVSRANWPTGADRLLLTQYFEFAAANEGLDLDTSHINWIVQVNGWTHPVVNQQTHDNEGLVRFKTSLA
ncbi:uncharacterized protein LTR77_000297 [Saxophila tyrrhenica]|uniref:Uncharacterized protein n=1 Tax=Saxophila tyrrhenica TaxID=1690608 RepID=A0AAV9PS47_9PEZI|nr:hypothetical protein LTR77_000297 [Saxophila tyrrhenica]